MDWWQFVAIVVAIIVPVGLAIHKAGQGRSERNIKRLDDHIAEDVKAHERIARLETKVEKIEAEVDTLRKRFHDTWDAAKRGTWELVDEHREKMADALSAFKAEIMRLIGK